MTAACHITMMSTSSIFLCKENKSVHVILMDMQRKKKQFLLCLNISSTSVSYNNLSRIIKMSVSLFLNAISY